MTGIDNDADFRRALQSLDYTRQRVLAARFIENVIALTADERVIRVTRVAADPDASADELSSALHAAKAAMLDSYTHCGAECNWRDQAGYFVARAAVAAVSPQGQLPGGPAWQCAMSSRMAQTCQSIDVAEDTAEDEPQAQYRMLSEFQSQ